MSDYPGLCWRCEHRARFHESGSRPRYECGDTLSAKYACYMFQPCLPVVTDALNKEDKRPRFAGVMISAREKFVRVTEDNKDVYLCGKRVRGGGIFLYWTPKPPPPKQRKKK